MHGISKNIIFKICVVLCVITNVVVAMPHHHHSHGEGVVCVNVFHCDGQCEPSGCDRCCVTEISDDALCCGACSLDSDHRHDGGCGDCYFSQLDIIFPARDRDHGVNALVSSFIINEFSAIGTARGFARSAYDGLVSEVHKEVYSGAIPFYTAFAAQAIPARAPSFTA